jgi:hypothetical protein
MFWSKVIKLWSNLRMIKARVIRVWAMWWTKTKRSYDMPHQRKLRKRRKSLSPQLKAKKCLKVTQTRCKVMKMKETLRSFLSRTIWSIITLKIFRSKNMSKFNRAIKGTPDRIFKFKTSSIYAGQILLGNLLNNAANLCCQSGSSSTTSLRTKT